MGDGDAALRLTVNGDRLWADIEAVNALGRVPGRPGINRPSFSPEDMAARRWLMGRLEDAGLAARMDGVGNVFGRWEAGAGPAVLAGSHLDTVPEGGPLDGTLGVCAALEAVRAMKEAGVRPVRPVEVVCTADEEGRFGGMLGSQAICGEVGADWIAAAVDENGRPLPDALAGAGLDGAGPLARDMRGVAAFLELHVEQGPVLEASGEDVGIADAVSGVFVWQVTLTGEANHSGTTPMHMRRDAFRGLAEFAAAIDRIVADVGSGETRLTVGKVVLSPNYPHSVAGEAAFTVVGRDTDARVMEALGAACRAAIARAAEAHGLDAVIREASFLPPTPLDAGLVRELSELATASGLSARVMPSGAGHDAQTFARHCPAALMFVPSVGGVSHAPHEWTHWPDVLKGATLFARALARLATE